jgi:DNA-binding IclR family transcriptional regulator
MEKLNDQSGETIKMVEHALKVLDLLRSKREPIGVNEIAKTCSLNPSTTFRILKTLEQSGWVFQFNDRRYITGQKISFVTEKNNLYLALREVAQFVMTEYTAKHGQAMNLTVREGKQCTILQQSRTNKFIDYVPPLFSNLPVYASAGGKILLSELPINLVDQIIHSIEMKPFTSTPSLTRISFGRLCWKQPSRDTQLTTKNPPKMDAASGSRFAIMRVPSSRRSPSAVLLELKIRGTC